MLSESTGEDDPEEIQQYVQRTDFLICLEEGGLCSGACSWSVQ